MIHIVTHNSLMKTFQAYIATMESVSLKNNIDFW